MRFSDVTVIVGFVTSTLPGFSCRFFIRNLKDLIFVFLCICISALYTVNVNGRAMSYTGVAHVDLRRADVAKLDQWHTKCSNGRSTSYTVVAELDLCRTQCGNGRSTLYTDVAVISMSFTGVAKVEIIHKFYDKSRFASYTVHRCVKVYLRHAKV